MEHYYHQHPRVEKYKTLAYADLPTIAQHALRDLKLKPLLNSFSKRSGPNCFATVAHAISTSSSSIADIWLHWEPLSRFLVEQGYKVTLDAPQARDIAVFMQNGRAVHGSVYLGENIVFEKPGQDFYEPYIISKLEKSKSDWPKSKLHIWRKC